MYVVCDFFSAAERTCYRIICEDLREFFLVGEISARRKEKGKTKKGKICFHFFAWGRFLRDLKISFPCGFWEAVEGWRVAEVDLVCWHTGFADIANAIEGRLRAYMCVLMYVDPILQLRSSWCEE